MFQVKDSDTDYRGKSRSEQVTACQSVQTLEKTILKIHCGQPLKRKQHMT
jgi:hypothetical protein